MWQWRSEHPNTLIGEPRPDPKQAHPLTANHKNPGEELSLSIKLFYCELIFCYALLYGFARV